MADNSVKTPITMTTDEIKYATDIFENLTLNYQQKPTWEQFQYANQGDEMCKNMTEEQFNRLFYSDSVKDDKLSFKNTSQDDTPDDTNHNPVTDQSEKYMVKSGDNLSTIAYNHNQGLGEDGQFMSVEALAILNGISDPNLISPGQELVLTADKSVVEDCRSRIVTFKDNLTELNDNIQKLSFENALGDDGADLDQSFSDIKNQFNNNVNTILEDAKQYCSWLEQLSKALDDTELYASNAMNSEEFSNPVGW